MRASKHFSNPVALLLYALIGLILAPLFLPVASAQKGAPSTSAARKRSDHWAFQPPVLPRIPTVKHKEWVRTPVDAFVLAGLEAAGIQPPPAADRRTLLRRVYLD